MGYDLYVQMVSEAVAELKGEEVREPAEIKLDLPVDANLPPDYVAGEEQRLEAYRRLAAVTTQAEVDDIRPPSGLDRYGPLPPPAEALLAVARLRAECVRTGVQEVTVARGDGPPHAAATCGSAPRSACSGWPATRSTRRTSASWSCPSPGAPTRSWPCSPCCGCWSPTSRRR